MARLLLYIGLILVVLWLLGFIAFRQFYVTTPIIHGIIVVGVILIILDLINSRRNWW